MNDYIVTVGLGLTSTGLIFRLNSLREIFFFFLRKINDDVKSERRQNDGWRTNYVIDRKDRFINGRIFKGRLLPSCG